MEVTWGYFYLFILAFLTTGTYLSEGTAAARPYAAAFFCLAGVMAMLKGTIEQITHEIRMNS